MAYQAGVREHVLPFGITLPWSASRWQAAWRNRAAHEFERYVPVASRSKEREQSLSSSCFAAASNHSPEHGCPVVMFARKRAQALLDGAGT